jgi:hypothetical protein
MRRLYTHPTMRSGLTKVGKENADASRSVNLAVPHYMSKVCEFILPI